MLASSIISSPRFKIAWENAVSTLYSLIIKSLGFGSLAGGVVFLWWSKFGRDLKIDKKNEGSGIVLTAKEVNSKLKRMNLRSDFYIGKMPLVKDSEVMHFLVTGSTGSGKTETLVSLAFNALVQASGFIY
ncbi:MAG: hypothetical protein EBX50_21925, partial [Chitinophagia bacterium]|nr:hypothetical protein [Chitinophagia bacterium]